MKKLGLCVCLLVMMTTGAYAGEAPVVNAFQQPGIIQENAASNNTNAVTQQAQQHLAGQMASATHAPTAFNPVKAITAPPPQQEFVSNGGNSTTSSQPGPPVQRMLLQKVGSLQQALRQLRGQLQEQQHDMQMMQQQIRELSSTPVANSKVMTTSANKSASPIIYGARQKAKAAGSQALDVLPKSNVLSKAEATQAKSLSMNKPVVPAKANNLQQDNTMLKQQLVYQAAFNAVKARHFTQALIDFKQFLKQYPKSMYVPNAHYWLGELYLLDGKLPPALQQFNMIVKQSPKHPKAAAAMYKIGMIYYDQNNWQLAKQNWNKLVKRYPKSSLVKIAKQRLQELAEAGH